MLAPQAVQFLGLVEPSMATGAWDGQRLHMAWPEAGSTLPKVPEMHTGGFLGGGVWRMGGASFRKGRESGVARAHGKRTGVLLEGPVRWPAVLPAPSTPPTPLTVHKTGAPPSTGAATRQSNGGNANPAETEPNRSSLHSLPYSLGQA